MLRLKSAGMKVRIVHVGRYVHPDYPGDCIVRVEAIDQPGWRREKSLHQLTGRPEEISRQLRAVRKELYPSDPEPVAWDRIRKVESQPSRFETLEDIFGTERPEGFQP